MNHPTPIIRKFANSSIRQFLRLALLALAIVPSLPSATGAVIAAVPLRWTVETSRAQPAVFEAYHGESLDLAATLQSYGKPVEIDPQADWNIYWQTNGMADAWWSAPATIQLQPTTNNQQPTTTATAVFTPAMDPGAPAVNGFLGSPGNNYRAAFTIRFRHAPGATPNAIAKPVPILDLANTTVINAPWPTDETIASTIRRVIEEDGITAGGADMEAVTNVVDDLTSDVVRQGDIEEYSEFGMLPPNTVADAQSTFSTIKSIRSKVTSIQKTVNAIPEWALEENPPESMPDDGVVWDGSNLTTKDGSKTVSAADVGAAPASIAGDIQSAYAWSQNVYRYMTANTNAWFAGTNYVTNAQQAALRHKFAFEAGMDLATVPCSMALWEIRDGEKVCVWDQRDWTSYYFEFKKRQIQDEINNLGTNKADRAWSHHTATGIDNPVEDTVWLDTPKVVLSAGYAWQRNVTTSGNGFFTLVSNGLWSFGNSAKGSFFEIKDFEGNSLFKVSKTDSYLADVEPKNVVPDGDDLLLRCLFDPKDEIDKTDLTVYGCNDLVTESWTDLSTADAPGTVSFTGVINDWTLRITPKNPQGKFFAFVKVKVEGQTKNEFAAPVEFTKIVIGGVTYTVGTATINGNTVLTLTR